MATLLEFISGLLDGVELIALAIVLGGLVHVVAVLRAPAPQAPLERRATRVSLTATLVGMGVWLLLRVVQLVLKPWALADATGTWAIVPFLETHVFRTALTGLVLMAVLAPLVWWVRAAPDRPLRWVVVLLCAGTLVANEAWLSHASGRLEGAGLLVAGTAVHMAAALVWAGGVAHLLAFRWVGRGDPTGEALWPLMVSRFSPVGLTCVALIVTPGLFLGWHYVGGWRGLVGTGYGNILLAKVWLFAGVLLLAALSFLAARRWRRAGETAALRRRVPAYLEVELVVAGTLLFTAAALTSLPPAVDTPEDLASPAEVWTMFAPKSPHLSGPELVLVEAPERINLTTGEMAFEEDWRWDRFNHNVSGVIVLLIAGLALLDRARLVTWARHWPLMFVAFSILIVVFANPDAWPLGPIGFVESLHDTEVVQHWLAAVVVLGLGLVEWQARSHPVRELRLPFLFPILCLAGGIVLLTHSHQVIELKREFLIQSTHVLMGILGIVVGGSRWLELRLPEREGRVAGFTAVAGIVLVGVILLFYITPD